jgi:hypothetical protein
MHTSVLTPAQDALSPMLPLSRRPVPAFPAGPAVSGVLPWPVIGEEVSPVAVEATEHVTLLDWRKVLSSAVATVPGVGVR